MSSGIVGNNFIVSDGSAATLTKVDTTIQGEGTIGDPYQILVNEAAGVIEANGGTVYIESTIDGRAPIAVNGTAATERGAVDNAVVSGNADLIVEAGFVLALNASSRLSGTVSGT